MQVVKAIVFSIWGPALWMRFGLTPFRLAWHYEKGSGCGRTKVATKRTVKQAAKQGTVSSAQAREAIRALLASRLGGRSKVGQWLAEHPLAEEFLTIWGEMRDAGETDWGLSRVVEHLQKEHGFPFQHSAVRVWMRRRRGQQ